jgi:preprotein translocase subunit SecG
MVINIPIYTKSYTEKVYLFEEEKLRTTIEIINKKWYDKFHLTLFATLSAIVFFIYSLYLSIISQNEIKVTIKEDLKKNSERIIDLGNKINDMDTKISNFLKKQIDKKPSKLRKSRK